MKFYIGHNPQSGESWLLIGVCSDKILALYTSLRPSVFNTFTPLGGICESTKNHEYIKIKEFF